MSIVEFAYRGTLYFPAAEVADKLGVTRDSFLRWCKAGNIPNDGRIEARKIGHRWFVTAVWFQSFLDSAAREQRESSQPA